VQTLSRATHNPQREREREREGWAQQMVDLSGGERMGDNSTGEGESILRINFTLRKVL